VIAVWPGLFKHEGAEAAVDPDERAPASVDR
jgi:hypothetical protein